MAEPILKWAGGKRDLAKDIIELINPESLEGHTYFEPFIGGGIMAFSLEHPFTVINDLNEELINLYSVIRANPHELISKLEEFQSNHDDLESRSSQYYNIRDWDKDPNFFKRTPVSRAARTVFLNRTCFNGLFRVNSKGYFNVPLGRTISGKSPDIVQADKIMKLHEFLNQPGVKIRNLDFATAVSDATKGDLVYFDPPYDYEDTGFTAYQKEGFSRDDLTRLKNLCDTLTQKKCRFILSNNDTGFVRELFKDYNFREITARRSINSDGSGRSGAKEVLIYN